MVLSTARRSWIPSRQSEGSKMHTPSSEVCKHSSLQQKMFQSRDNQSLYGINIFQSKKKSYSTVLSGTINELLMWWKLRKKHFGSFSLKKKKHTTAALVSHSCGYTSKYQQCQNTAGTQLCAVRKVTGGALWPKATNTSPCIWEQPKVQVRWDLTAPSHIARTARSWFCGPHQVAFQ